MATEAVIDASTFVKTVITGDETGYLRERLHATGLHAPHLIDAEAGDALRRQVVRGEIEADTALTALLSLQTVIEERYPHSGPLARDAWGLRHQVRFYDGLYVALAARLGLRLLTADARLGRTHQLPCEIEVV